MPPRVATEAAGLERSALAAVGATIALKETVATGAAVGVAGTAK